MKIKPRSKKQQMQQVATDVSIIQYVATMMVTEGARILQDDFDMTVDESAKWASMTIKAAQAEMDKGSLV